MTHGAVRTDNMLASRGGHILSMKAHVELDNGSVVMRGEFADGVFATVAPTGTVAVGKAYLVASPEVVYRDEEDILDFTNEEGAMARCYEIYENDRFTITDLMITGESVVGQHLVFAEGETKLAAAESAATGLSFVVLEKTTIYGEAATRVMAVVA